ncbi:MAG: hypothetical protein ACXW18_04970 [Pyrinomonadaceae bacterium]
MFLTETMKSCVRILPVLLLTVFAVNAQTNKSQTTFDISGKWLLDRSKSNAGDFGKRDTPVVIVYNEPELRITRTLERNGQPLERDFVYYTDGRGETNMALILLTTNPGNVSAENIDKEVIKSKTTRQRDKIVIRATGRNMAGTHVLEYEMVDEWKLSGDGKTLTQTSRMIFRPDLPARSVYVPAGRPDDKRVYSRVN